MVYFSQNVVKIQKCFSRKIYRRKLRVLFGANLWYTVVLLNNTGMKCIPEEISSLVLLFSYQTWTHVSNRKYFFSGLKYSINFWALQNPYHSLYFSGVAKNIYEVRPPKEQQQGIWEASIISVSVVNNLKVSDLQLKSVQQILGVQNSQTYMRSTF